MPLASSPTFHNQPAVHPHEPGIHLTTSLAGAVVPVLRHWSCRTSGVAVLACLAFPIRLTGCP